MNCLAPRLSRCALVFFGLFAFGLCHCLSAPSLDSVFYPEKLAEMDAAINQAIAEKRTPGGVLWFEHRGVAYHKAYGHRSLVPDVEPMTEAVCTVPWTVRMQAEL